MRTLARLAAMAWAGLALAACGDVPTYELRLTYGAHVYVLDYDLSADDCAQALALNLAYAAEGHTFACAMEGA